FIPETVKKIEKALEGSIKPTEGYLFPRIVEIKQQPKSANPTPEEKLIIGEIVEIKKHPNADGLQVVEINVGKDSPVIIVTSAQNIKTGDIVPVILPGGRVNSADGKIVKIEKGKLRGVVSFGMMASELELGLGPDHHGIYILKTELKDNIGQPLKNFLPIKIKE
ncbi:MAG TPA: hypothetical protein VF828_02875, partial [Patescibacteria group bacterium]